MIHLKTKRLLIRDYRETDLPQYYQLFTDPQVINFIEDTKLNSINEAHQRLATEIGTNCSDDRIKYFFAIEEWNTGKFLGEIGFTITSNHPAGKIANLGYLLLPQYWHHGYITEAANQVIDFAFKQCNVHKIMAGCLLANVASEKVMKKCQMKKEGQYEQQFWHEGHWVASVEYGLLLDDWKSSASAK
jgi:ribosomal-protein-alanine N-acetyltransferase